MPESYPAGNPEAAWLEAVFDTIDEGCCVIELIFEGDTAVDYRFLKANAQFERQAGITVEPGRTARQLMPDLEASWFEVYGRVALTGEPIRFENESPLLGRWFDTHAWRVGGADSRQVALLFSDITARKTYERVTFESQHRFRDMADNAPLMMSESDASGRITFWNRTWLAFTGRSFEQSLGMDWAGFIHPDDYPDLFALITRSYAERRPYQTDVRVADRDDRYHWLEFRGSPTFNAAGDLTGYVATGLDVTDRKTMERQKDDFIAVASHELKTPLTSIKAYTQILERRFKRTGDDKSADSMNRINTQLDRLNTLVGDLLDITKVETGMLRLHVTEFDFDAAVAEAVETVQLTADRHSIAVHGFTGAMVWGDRDRTEQVVINLLGNAIKYSPTAPNIEVKLSADGRFVRVDVQDHGVGIPADKLSSVFERFYRVGGKAMESFPGLGLGLYISRQIISRLGGKIWAESTEGEGAVFSVQLPVDRRSEQRAFEQERRQSQVREASRQAGA